MRTAIVGCGAIAAQHLPFLASSPLSDLVGVCDSSPAAAAFAQSRFDAREAFTSLEDMLRLAEPQVVHVLTPPHTHDQMVRMCLDSGAHVICEKPMAATARSTAALLAHAAERGLCLFESRNYLFNDPVIRLHDEIQAGRVGRVLEIDLLLAVNFLGGPFGDLNLSGPGVDLPGGAVHDFLPHLSYLFLHFGGHEGEVESVEGRLSNRSGNRRAMFDHLDALVRAGDVTGRLRIAADIRPETFRVCVRGDEASIETDLFHTYYRFEGPPDIGKRSSLGMIRNGAAMARAGVKNFRDKVMQHGPYHGMPRMLAAIYRSLDGQAPPPFRPDDLLDTALLTDRLVALGEAQ